MHIAKRCRKKIDKFPPMLARKTVKVELKSQMLNEETVPTNMYRVLRRCRVSHA